jgi:hypothetical protein
LDLGGHSGRAKLLHMALPQGSALPWIELEPSQAADPGSSPIPSERDERWHVIIRRQPERDE